VGSGSRTLLAERGGGATEVAKTDKGRRGQRGGVEGRGHCDYKRIEQGALADEK
jgi:hypothetical protein